MLPNLNHTIDEQYFWLISRAMIMAEWYWLDTGMAGRAV
jgi:hypothetical protein